MRAGKRTRARTHRYSVFYDDGDVLDHRLVAERWKVRILLRTAPTQSAT
jgi:hypothetical protein